MKEEISKFKFQFGVPQTFGAIDWVHISLERPMENSHNYFS